MTEPIDNIRSDYSLSYLVDLQRQHNKTVVIPPDGSKTVTFTAVFGSGEAGDVLRISDGSTTIDYTCTEAGGGNAAGAAQIGSGSDRAANSVVDEFVSKINASALNVTAADNGGSSTNSSFTLTPDTGVTITITEDPGNANSGNFGHTAGHTAITSGTGSSTTVAAPVIPLRLSVPGPASLRGQTIVGSTTEDLLNRGPFKTSIGKAESFVS